MQIKRYSFLIFYVTFALISGGSAHADSSNSDQSQIETIVKVASGMRHNCALTSLGRVACWGDGSMGQLGISENTSSNFEMDNYSKVSAPVFIEKLQGVVDIAAGTFHTCAVLGTGQAFCWGLGYQGQLGNEKRNIEYSPTVVKGISNIASVSPGTYHTCAIDTVGKVFCWGSDTRGYGARRTGQLGDGLSYLDSLKPKQVKGLRAPALKISSGESHTCVVLVNKKLQCWGKGTWGQLGYGGRSNSASAVASVVSEITEVSASFENTCGIIRGDSQAEVWCWGFRTWGALGDGSALSSSYNGVTRPVKTRIVGASFLDSGGGSACAVVDNAPWCWGSNLFGQLQNTSGAISTGDWFVDRSSNPSKIDLPTPIFGVAVSKGIEFESTYAASVCAWSSIDIYCWGGGEPTGQLGSGEFTEGAVSPVRVIFPSTGAIVAPPLPDTVQISISNNAFNLEITHNYEQSQGFLLWQVHRLDTGELICEADGRRNSSICTTSGLTHRESYQFSIQGRNETGFGDVYVTESKKFCVSNPVRIVTFIDKKIKTSGSQFSASGYWENNCSDPKNEIEYRSKLFGKSWSKWEKIPLLDSTHFNLLKNITYNTTLEFRGQLDSQYFYSPVLQVNVTSKNLDPLTYSPLPQEMQAGTPEGRNLQATFEGDSNFTGICTIYATTDNALNSSGNSLGAYSKSTLLFVSKGSGQGQISLEWSGLYKINSVCRDPNFLEIRNFKVLRIK